MTQTERQQCLARSEPLVAMVDAVMVEQGPVAVYKAHRVHCEAVAEWRADARAGVEPEQRRGWPNYDGRDCQ